MLMTLIILPLLRITVDWCFSSSFLPSFLLDLNFQPLTTLLRIHYEDSAVDGPTKHGNASRRYLDAMTQSSTMDERKGERIHWWPFNDRSDCIALSADLKCQPSYFVLFVVTANCRKRAIRESEGDRYTKNVYMRGIYRDRTTDRANGRKTE